jgi:hypothetical protein
MTTYRSNDSRSILSRSSQSRSNATWRTPDQGVNPKVRYAKYVELARAAALTGDVVETENYYQHAEHYFRMIHERTG